MYRLREMTMDDKVCEQVSLTMLGEVYPKEVIERCVQQSEPWSTKARRVRLSTALTLVFFVIAMALWSRRNQCQVWQSLVGKLSDLHPSEPKSTMSDAGLSGRRTALGSQCVQALMRERCQLIAQPESMPSAFFGRYRLMAIDGTLFNTPDTKANALAFGRSSNQYGPGAYPQVRCVLLAECGPHGVVGQVYRLVTTLLNPRVDPALELIALYHERWEVELVIDEIKTHQRAQRKVLRSKTPEGVRQELYGIYLAHYAVRVLLAQAAVERELDPDRLSFTEGLFELTEMLSLALTLAPEEPTDALLNRLRHETARHGWPAGR